MLFGLTQGDWAAEVQAAWEILQDLARRKEGPVTYGWLFDELGRRGHKRPEMFQVSSGRLLGDIAMLELREGRPPLTALVVNQDRGLPGSGFWDVLTLGAYTGKYDLSDKDQAWFSAFTDVIYYWSSLPPVSSS